MGSGELHGFRTSPDKPIQPGTDDIGTLGGANSYAAAINDAGRVTGSSEDIHGVNHAFVTGANRPIDPYTDDIDMKLGQFSTSSRGDAINNRGHVLGTIIGYPLYPTALLNQGRTSRTLPFIRYIWESYAGVTDQEQVVSSRGQALELWENGKTSVLAPCASLCVPTDVNNTLQIVGSDQKFPFLYSDGIIYDLNIFFPQESGWVLPDTRGGPIPLAINDLGQIAGIAELNGETHGFRLDPIPSLSSAIQQTMNLVRSLQLNPGRKNAMAALLKLSLASKLNAASDASARSSPGATRGLLNEFENIVRANTGGALSKEQADQLLEMAEAAIAMT